MILTGTTFYMLTFQSYKILYRIVTNTSAAMNPEKQKQKTSRKKAFFSCYKKLRKVDQSYCFGVGLQGLSQTAYKIVYKINYYFS